MSTRHMRGSKLLRPEEVQRYEENGIVFPVPVVPPNELQRFQEGLDRKSVV